jgi:hypothetical protein
MPASFGAVPNHLLPDTAHFIEAPYTMQEIGLLYFQLFMPVLHFSITETKTYTILFRFFFAVTVDV